MASKPLPIIHLMGPTASGKTACAIELVKRLPCEIISVDSALVYREMNIGTAKPEQEVLQQAPHFLIDIRNPDETYSVAEFCEDAKKLIDEIHARAHIPLLVGGTIMYFHSLHFGLSELPPANAAIRARLDTEAKESGWENLHQQLAEVDPQSAAKIHPNDAQRIQRAWEVYELTGVKLSAWHDQRKPTYGDVPLLNIGLFPSDRAQLHAQIAQRFEQMINAGFISEVEALREKWKHLNASMPSMRCVGYRQAWAHLEGTINQQEMFDQAIAATRQLAKRQLTWLRHYPETQLIDTSSHTTSDIINQIIFQIERTSW